MGFSGWALLFWFAWFPIYAQADGLSIACMDDSGKPTSTSSCNAILPKCSELKTSYEKAVKNFLSWKIWGYYNGKNIDLDSSSLNATTPNLSGPDLLYPICSIVGHKMQFTGTPPLKAGYAICDKTRKTQNDAYASAGIEYAAQTIGKKTSCGLRPDTDSGSTTLTLKFANGAGNLWNSYLVGAYPWLIRRHAYEVLSALKPDLSNIGDLVSDASVKTDMSALNTKMSAYYTALSTESKAICVAAESNVAQKCSAGTMSITDPSNRICTLVKAQATLNSGGIPNILVKEIMKRVQTQYDELFNKLLSFNVPSSQNLWNKCKDTGSLFRAGKKKQSMSASCLFDGAEFYTYDNNLTTENGCTGSASHRGTYPVAIQISDGKAVDMGNAASMSSGLALTLGFTGVIESIIRRDICKQQTSGDESICDTVNIPDKPEGVQ